MIEISKLFILGFILFIFTIGLLLKNKLCKLKDTILFLNADIDYLEREVSKLEEKNTSLEESLLTKVNIEKALNIEILRLNRLKNSTKITKEELSYFANNIDNDIKLSMCHTNAYKTYEKYGGKVQIGKANVIINDKEPRETSSHLWNVVKYLDNNIEKEQLVDILNYKDNQAVSYADHKGQDIPIDEVLTDKKFNYI